MESRRRRRFVHAQMAWMLTATVVLVALDSLALDLLFVVSLIGFLEIGRASCRERVCLYV